MHTDEKSVQGMEQTAVDVEYCHLAVFSFILVLPDIHEYTIYIYLLDLLVEGDELATITFCNFLHFHLPK